MLDLQNDMAKVLQLAKDLLTREKVRSVLDDIYLKR